MIEIDLSPEELQDFIDTLYQACIDDELSDSDFRQLLKGVFVHRDES